MSTKPKTEREARVQAQIGRGQLQNEIARDLGASLVEIRRSGDAEAFERALAEVRAFNQKHFPLPQP